ncbi:MAG: FAD-dependent oxidoreductase [Bacteroidales bacterium]|nr:FAD-dependent oxidoreductase [Bacteroidales bacterium]
MLVIGGGSSGMSAALQAARMGIPTTVVEETPWLGGMLTSAGVSATDGNHKMRQGIFGEFISALASHYGSLSALKTGWVSNTLYEPRVGEKVFEDWAAAESNLTVIKEAVFESISKDASGWTASFSSEKGNFTISADRVIDCTELGDVAKAAGVKYHVGMDSPSYTGESQAIGPNDVVQDITMCMTLKNFGKDVTIAKPEGYDESLYYNCCENPLNVNVSGGKDAVTGQTIWPASQMLSYGLLPGGEYMINWPIHGNDYYVNLIDMSREERAEAIRKAKLHSLGFLYFMQTKLGYNYLGLSDNEYPSEDRMPFIPYHRESRRIEGEYLFTVTEASSPFDFDGFRSGIAVGDYPVDHHHYQYTRWMDISINFPSIVPFTLPLGVLIPKEKDDLLVAEKSISVSNIVNGTTRLQPITMELGQAAGALAALSILYEKDLRHTGVRRVLKALLESGARLQPYLDLDASNADFQVLQRIGSTGIMRGRGQTVGWSNEMRFRNSDKLLWNELYLEEYYDIPYNSSSAAVTGDELISLIEKICGHGIESNLKGVSAVSRLQAAKLIDKELDPFNSFEIGLDGKVIR